MRRAVGHMVFAERVAVAAVRRCRTEQRSVVVALRPGMRAGDRIVRAHGGDQRPGAVPGHLVLELRCSDCDGAAAVGEVLPIPDTADGVSRPWAPLLWRRGDDLHVTAHVSLREALAGFARRLTLPDKTTIRVSTRDATPHGGVKVVRGGGMPRPGAGTARARGDLHVHIRVVWPHRLSPEQLRFFQEHGDRLDAS